METKAICKGIIIQRGTRWVMMVPHKYIYICYDGNEGINDELVRELVALKGDELESGHPDVIFTEYQTKADIIKAVRRMVRDKPDETTAKEKLERIRNIVEEDVE